MVDVDWVKDCMLKSLGYVSQSSNEGMDTVCLVQITATTDDEATLALDEWPLLLREMQRNFSTECPDAAMGFRDLQHKQIAASSLESYLTKTADGMTCVIVALCPASCADEVEGTLRAVKRENKSLKRSVRMGCVPRNGSFSFNPRESVVDPAWSPREPALPLVEEAEAEAPAESERAASRVARLVRWATSGTDAQKEEAAQTLWTLVHPREDAAGGFDAIRALASGTEQEKEAVAARQVAVAAAGAVMPLVGLMREGKESQKTNAGIGLRALAASNAVNKAAIAAAAAIAPLASLARLGTDAQKSQAAGSLFNLSAGGVYTPVPAVADATEAQKAQASTALKVQSAGTIAPLVALMRNGTDAQHEYSASVLASMARDQAHQTPLAAAGAIVPLVALARDGTPSQKRVAAGALWNLGWNDSPNKMAIAGAGGVEVLVALAREGTPGQREEAAGALSNLAREPEIQTLIVAADGVAPLVFLAENGSEAAAASAAGALRNLACESAHRKAIAAAGAISPLIELMRNGSEAQRLNASGALDNLLADKETKKLVKKAGCASRSHKRAPRARLLLLLLLPPPPPPPALAAATSPTCARLIAGTRPRRSAEARGGGATQSSVAPGTPHKETHAGCVPGVARVAVSSGSHVGRYVRMQPRGAAG